VVVQQDFYQPLAAEANLRDHVIRFVGGTTAVTAVAGTAKGVTVTYISTGIVDLTWAVNPGLFLGATFGFQATTQSAVKGYTAVAGAFNTTTFTLRLNITSASDALIDLAAVQWLCVRAAFADPSV
jgi:hypothetical protein